jgi:uncharacterized SAM-binding protein YcdF (DUF218 family)
LRVHPRLRQFFVALVVLLLAIIAVYVFRETILVQVANFLIIDDKPAKADIIYVLNGDHNTRPYKAAELYKSGYAPKVVIARAEDSPASMQGLIANDTDISDHVFQLAGIPETAIVELKVPGGVSSTFDEAISLRQYCREKSLHRVIVVTSSFHTRRARWIIARLLSPIGVEVLMAQAPDAKYGPQNWWKSEDGLIACQNEYLKLIYYWFKYKNRSAVTGLLLQSTGRAG